jgi:polyisoprenoid-binding protein YceI
VKKRLYALTAALLVSSLAASPVLAQAAKKPLPAKPASVAAEWVVVPAKSSIAYSGTHAGRTFNGSFSQWTAAIRFDPAKLAEANATVRIMLASSKTGDKTYDETLPGGDWFDIGKTPVAMFQSQRFREITPGKYVADGILTLRNMKVPVSLPFSLAIAGNTATMSGQVTLKRMAFGLGKTSDPSGDWVSLDIPVTVKVTATRKK